jgi:transposase
MDRLVERCAGLDVHKDSVAATVRVPGSGSSRERLQETRTFSATTRGLLTLADWLASYGVTLVVMEATGVYWKPVVRHEAPFDLVGMEGPHLRAVAAAC